MNTKNSSPQDAKQRAGRAFEKAAQRKSESDVRVEEQRKADLSLAAKIKGLRELRMQRDAAQAEEAANAPPPVKVVKSRKKAPVAE
ncbi:hypothetical protein GCM10007036_24960 [Alsobacter metallidurans]|jgi:hypothetical protein|uniref:Uncharacterized protein n=1 Tax=Alsobacter metallidurans TaxID=340221 RepID=A0A917MI49_9HYPH|nr:hypothetical protein [Alsobacter metallidurans]GGH20992.1 hypothetical protein GCM10007036_24960 [Alsobacter metallidurans]